MATTIRLAIMNVITTWPSADTVQKRLMAVAYAWDKPLRPQTDYVTGRTSDGLVDVAWKVEGVAPTNEFYPSRGHTRRREQWLLASESVRLADLIGRIEVERIDRDLAPGQYVVKYVDVDLPAPTP